MITIGIPCFNEEENIIVAYQELKKTMSKIIQHKYELIFVDNGSTDRTKELIIKIAKRDKAVKGIFLSRNFGPESSGQAALDKANGDAFIGIGCDLQDPPETILKFIDKWEKGYDIVLGVYTKLDEFIFMRAIKKIFYRLLNKIAFINIPKDSTGFGLFDKKVINALRMLPEKNRFGRGLLSWVGFKRTYVTYERRRRLRGKSSYNIFSYLKHAERGIFGFSYTLLDIMVYLGFLLVLFSFLFIAVYLYMVVYVKNPINASIPTMITIVFFGSIQLLAISIIGKYIQVIVEETKNRPMYIVEKTVNIDK